MATLHSLTDHSHNSLSIRVAEMWKNRRKACTESRFWKRCDKTAGEDGCWLWLGAKNKAGYGVLGAMGKMTMAHRFAFIAAGKPLAKGQLVCHHCDNPPCVNPKHLFAGSAADNTRDSILKGRHSSVPK